MKRSFAVAVAAVVTFGAISVSVAQPQANPDQAAIEARQGLFKLMGWAFGPMGGMLQNKVPFDAAAAQTSAARIQALSEMISDAFARDTRQFKGTRTGALDSIWSGKAEFAAKANDMNKVAADFVAAAKTGDRGATLKAAGQVGKACGSCHDSFRQK